MNPADAAAELARYTTRETRTSSEREWTKLRVEILRDGKLVGSYDRNYSLLQTFRPFIGPDDRLYALYSRNYTATRVMSLPDCRDLGGEEPASGGFCPAEYFVPYDPTRGLDGSIGFVAGCVWGDDSSWKVQFLDLSRVADGVVSRDDRFGYLELEDGMKLAEAVDLREWNLSDRIVRIKAIHPFEVDRPQGAADPTVLLDERGIDADAEVPRLKDPAAYDAFYAEFVDASTNHSSMRSQEVQSLAEGWSIAARWHRERGVHVNLRGRTFGRYGMPPDQAIWPTVVYIDQAGKVVVSG